MNRQTVVRARPLSGAPQRRPSEWIAFVFILPTFIAIGLFSYYPAIRALVGAFTSWNGVTRATWVGVSNFVQALSDPNLLGAAWHILLWAIIGIPLALIPAFIVAELIFRLKNVRAQYIFRTLLIIPMVLPTVVMILLWYFFYEPGGIIGHVLSFFGNTQALNQAWLANPHWALLALIVIGFPWIGAFHLLIYLAGLQGIPTDVFDASQIDGCTWTQRLWRIDIPLLLPQIKLLLVLTTVGVAQVLVVPLLMTNGGPFNATMTPVLYMYQWAVDYDKYGYSMSVAFMLFVVILGLTIVNMKYFKTDTSTAS